MGDRKFYSAIPIESSSNYSLSKSHIIRMSMNDPEKQKSEPVSSTSSSKAVRKWVVFPGRNRFYCDGRLMLSTQTGIFYFTIFLIVVTSGCFFAMDGSYAWTNMHPLVPLLAAVQCIFVLVVLCRTALGDPGIIPRASPAEAAALEKLIEQEQNAAAQQSKTGNMPYRPPPRIRDVTVGGVPFKLKYCYTCKIFRPPRASHCSVCDNCVDRFDHHCPWVGNCVGRRNYKFFYLFLTSLTVYCAYLMSVSVAAIVLRSKESSFAIAMQQGPLSPVVALVAFFSIWSVAGLGGFHSYLVAVNITTNEDIKGTFKKSNGGNPFSGSCLTNCATVLCGPLPPSLIDRRGWVTQHDIPTTTLAPTSGRPIVQSTTYTDGQINAASNSTSRSSSSGFDVPTTGYPSAEQGAAGTIERTNNKISTEATRIANGRALPTNPPKYLPPIGQPPQQPPNQQTYNREYLA